MLHGRGYFPPPPTSQQEVHSRALAAFLANTCDEIAGFQNGVLVTKAGRVLLLGLTDAAIQGGDEAYTFSEVPTHRSG